MMAQFLGIKEEVGPDILLFYRMGDFYELFFDDAIKAASALDIALTKRGKHKGEDIPMCGVPVHASETYLQRLIKKGFRVAVCEQTEDPKEAKKRGSKSVVRREVVRLVTPGTLTEDSLLDARCANIILAVAHSPAGAAAIAWADISDGRLHVSAPPPGRLGTEISALAPSEIIAADTAIADKNLRPIFDSCGASLTPLAASRFDPAAGARRLTAHYGAQDLSAFGDLSRSEIAATAALVDYIEHTQAGQRPALSAPIQHKSTGFMAIDPATRASLEITRTQSGNRKGSLLSVIDNTVTGPGARLLADRLARPLLDAQRINARLDAVSFFDREDSRRASVRETLRSTGDAARASSRIVLGRGGPRDLIVIAAALAAGEALNGEFIAARDNLPANIASALDALNMSGQPQLAKLRRDIEAAIKPGPPMLARDGGFIAQGWHTGLDQINELRTDSRQHIAQLQAQYSAQTNITGLKIKHNNVLGYFVEVTARHADALLTGEHKDTFIHRQTLVSGIRFTTTALADLDQKIASAAEKALAIEHEIFAQFCQRVSELSSEIRAAADALARLDVTAALAQWAGAAQCVRPKINSGTMLDIEGGRHPVVEAALRADDGSAFTVNDCQLGGENGPRLTLITGPNMAGKSTYLRQNALMFVLAQAGCFVPAKRAEIGIADALFSRVGASDDLSKGRSTFMTEMIETAAILNQAGPRSFVILDEIGRGTATYDGLSIAWAVAEHLHGVNKCRALFATHYHEMTSLIDELPAASNACLHAKEWDGELVFMHDVRPGAADKSYGIAVAKLAGLPQAAIARARAVLSRLESQTDGGAQGLGNLPLFSAAPPSPAKPSPADIALAKMDIDALSPRAALDALYELREMCTAV